MGTGPSESKREERVFLAGKRVGPKREMQRPRQEFSRDAEGEKEHIKGEYAEAVPGKWRQDEFEMKGI